MAEHNQQFETFDQWCNKASSWLLRCHEDSKPHRAVCYDQKGRLCAIGGDFMRARDEGAFPVRWVWDFQVPGLVVQLELCLKDLVAEWEGLQDGYANDDGTVTDPDTAYEMHELQTRIDAVKAALNAARTAP